MLITLRNVQIYKTYVLNVLNARNTELHKALSGIKQRKPLCDLSAERS